jgi:uncharacterized protein YPO0396
MLSSFTAINSLTVISCNTITEKEKNAQVVEHFDNSLGVDTLGFENDVRIFRQMMDKKIEANSQHLSGIRKKIKKDNKKADSDTSTTIFELELANGYMKLKLEKYQQHEKGDWEVFKRQFNREMNNWTVELAEFESNI